jgi:hypothetical protein
MTDKTASQPNMPHSLSALAEFEPGSQSTWRDKIWPLLLWLGLITLLFRPLLWNDIREIASPALGADKKPVPPPGQAGWNLAVDLVCYLLCCFTLVQLIVGRIGFIALNTFREAVRNRILYFILFFALILMLASGIVKELSIVAHERIVTNLGLSCISFFGLMTAVFVGISLVYNELDKKTIYTIVSKPVHRFQFLLGKFFGLLLTIYVIVGIMTVFFFAVFNYQAQTTDQAVENVLYSPPDAQGVRHLVERPGLAKTAFLAKAMGKSVAQSAGNVLGFPSGAVSQNMLIAVAMICLELMIITAVAVLFSSFSTPSLSAMFTVMVFAAGRLNEDILRFANRVIADALKERGAATFAALSLGVKIKVWFAQLCALIVPNLDSLNVTSSVVYSDTISVWRYSVLYAFCYTAMVLMLAILIFRKRNFK